ncbi:MAG: hypothetical protein L6N95_00805 [Candidatus Methylarchaceae archaeon HK01B]|nr:hypothetical protein [Candidatus Methylarchaceae archaeon HK01M]MCP8318352.1 hypothetical protein [Candidatus Methylarchaceae archaeon HK01B]
MNEDISATIKYARRKLKEYRRLLSMDALLRYSSIEVDILMNSSESLIGELEAHLKNKPREKTELEINLIKEITYKVDKLKKNLEEISSNLAKTSLSILSADDIYLE